MPPSSTGAIHPPWTAADALYLDSTNDGPGREGGRVPMPGRPVAAARATRLGPVSGGGSDQAELNERGELGVDGLSAVAMIGSGGSSTVYRARQDALDREVAVKVVHAAWTMETRERFEHERELMGRLSGHTAIVPIFETGITKRGEPYLLMPYYHRGSLFRLMRDRGPLPWPEAGFLLETVALTLADCHREGIVHRDVKPGNVMLTRHLHPRLADFGIALPLDMTTSPATVAYTPSYSPPEAYEPGVAAPTIDVFGLGATLWALLAGQAPDQDARSVRPPKSDLPPALADLIERAMNPDPARRPPDAAAFATELRRATRLASPADHPDRLGGLPRTGAGTAPGAGPGVQPTSARAGLFRGRFGLMAIGTALAGGAVLITAGLWSLLT